MAKFKTGSINLDKIDKSKLFKGKNGTYLNFVIWENDTPDAYGNDFAVQQSATKEDRDAGYKGPYLGNGKNYGATKKLSKSEQDDLGF